MKQKEVIKNIAVIGVGYWGTILINSLYKINCKNIFVYDKQSKNLATIKKRFPKIIIAKSYFELLENKDVKSFLLATPPNTNYDLCKKAINHNKNIYVEKPVVKNINELKRLKKILKNKKNIFMTGYIYCYNDYINYIKKIINRNFLGEIKYINLIRKNFGPIRSSVSSSMDLSSHDISILIHIFKKNFDQINSSNHSVLKNNIHDITNLSYKMGKIKIDINSSWLYPEKLRKIIIIGKKRMLLFDEMNAHNPIKIYNKYAEYPKVDFFSNKFFSKKIKIFEGKSRSIKIRSKPALVNELNHFFYCIKNKKKPITSIYFAEKILKKIN